MSPELNSLYQAIETNQISKDDLQRVLLDTLWEIHNRVDDKTCEEIAEQIKEYYF